MSADLELIVDPAAEAAYRRQLAREAYRDGYEAGDRAGYERGARLLEVTWPAVAAALVRWPGHAEVERRRWHVCCRECRRRGHRNGCARCEDRTPGAYASPHTDDYPGQGG